MKQSVLLSALDNYGGHPFDGSFDIVHPCYGTREIRIAKELAESVALVIWGGQDISPSIYNQVPNKHTDAGNKPGSRDSLEIAMAETAIELGIPIIGICRGAQLMCAMSGGTLVQHVENHAGGWHGIETHDGKFYNCPSLHHQMMHPWARADKPKEFPGIAEFELLAWAHPVRSKVYHCEPQGEFPDEIEADAKPIAIEVPCEPEVIWIPKTKSLCVQSHPEYIQNVEHPFNKYVLSLVEKYVKGTPNNRG